MNFFQVPRWIEQYNYAYERFEEVPASLFKSINQDLDERITHQPLVSVVITAWNEEVNILRTIGSLSRSVTTVPFEIIVINNNSTDNTQKTLDQLHVKNFFQPVQGWGPARQMGLEKAAGKYVLMADADCFYPPGWVDEMTRELEQPGIACVYGRYSFLTASSYPRWKLFFFEKMKDTIAELRHFKRPYLNAYGMSMGYVREYGLREGYVMKKIRGEDGRLCFDLMKHGRIRQVRSNSARVWTRPRTLQTEGSLGTALRKRVKKEMRRIFSLFTVHPPHDTKTSEN